MSFDSTMVQTPCAVNIASANNLGGTVLNRIIAPNVPTPAGSVGVNSLALTAGGSGFTTAPVNVVFTGGGGSGAAAVAYVGFPITAVSVTNPGVYQTMPTVSATRGTGATLTPTMQAVGAVVNAPGSGYTPGDGLTVSGGTSSQSAVIIINHTTLVNSGGYTGGTGYAVGDQIKLSGGTATFPPIVQVLTVNGSGTVTGFSLIQGGTFTVNASTLTQGSTTGSGTGFTFTGALYGVGDATIYPLTPGAYTALPASPVSVTGGTGTGATFLMNWGLLSVAVTAGGTGFDSNSVMTTSGGSGFGGQGNLTLASTGAIKGLELTANGSGYGSAPTVSFTGGGGGSGATATATIGSTGTQVSVNMVMNLPSNYSITGCASQPATISYSNKTKNGFTVTLVPPTNTTISAGTVDLVIDYTQ